MSEREGRRRRWVFRVATPLMLMIGLVGSAEVGLRVYHERKAAALRSALPPLAERAVIPSDDPRLIYRLNPGWKGGDGFTVNQFGMPDRERTRAPVAGTRRVACVGDSISCNLGLLPREQGWVRQLEVALARERPSECLNFGVNGYGIDQTVRSAELALAFEPEVLVVQLCLNDPYPSDGEYVQALPRRGSRAAAFVSLRLDPARFWAEALVERAYDATGRAAIAAGLSDLARATRGGPKVLAVLFPYLHAPAYSAWGFGEYHDLFQAAATAAGVPLLDLREPFQAAGLIGSTWPVDPLHPTAEGHALAAKLVHAELARRGWLDAD